MWSALGLDPMPKPPKAKADTKPDEKPWPDEMAEAPGPIVFSAAVEPSPAK